MDRNVYRVARDVSLDDVRTVDDLVALYAAIDIVKERYEKLNLSPPGWMQKRLDEIDAETKERAEAERRGKLRELESRLEALKSREEKKEDIVSKIAELRKELGEKQ